MPKKISFQEKIFVAGASGMAGSAICRALKKHGYGVQANGGNTSVKIGEKIWIKASGECLCNAISKNIFEISLSGSL